MKTAPNEIFEKLAGIPMLDIHTHLDASHLSARGLHDILLYHMVISDLYSAGCPNGARLSEDPGENEVAYRVEQALPYLEYIQNTSCFWGVRLILKDLYDWELPITKENWRHIHSIIRKKSMNPQWPRDVLKKACIDKACTELWRRRDRSADDFLVYSLEWGFFARCQWGQFDTALLELEHAWAQESSGAPLPVSGGDTIRSHKRIQTVEDIQEAITHYCDLIPYDQIISTAQHLSTDIEYSPYSA